MEKMNHEPEHALGRKTRRNIFGAGGVLLVPEYAFISREYAEKLRDHGVVLTEEDLLHEEAEDPCAPSSPHQRIIDETVAQVNELFSEVRVTRKLPLAEFRKEVVPAVYAASDGSHLFDLFATLQAKDDYTFRHHVAVGAIAGLLGRWMKLERQELQQLITAALLHDVGKMLIPAEVLQKPGKLTEQEYDLMKKHTIFGYELLKGTVGVNHRQALAALQHHERLDGSGYPFGVGGDKIDSFSRIVAVADSFHAMISNRAYREPMSIYEALDELRTSSFGRLDPVVTRVFLERIAERLQGTPVILTDGSEGTVVLAPPHDPMHPLIQVGEKFVDLGKDSSVRIRHIW